MRCKLRINRGRTAYFGKKVEFDGLKFDSEKEAKFYERFIYGRDLNATVHESFTIRDEDGNLLHVMMSKQGLTQHTILTQQHN